MTYTRHSCPLDAQLYAQRTGNVLNGKCWMTASPIVNGPSAVLSSGFHGRSSDRTAQLEEEK